VLHEQAGDVHVVTSVTLSTCPLDTDIIKNKKNSTTFSPVAAVWRLSVMVRPGFCRLFGGVPLTSDSVPMPPWPVGSGGMDGRAALATDPPACAGGSLHADAPFLPLPFRNGAPLGHT